MFKDIDQNRIASKASSNLLGVEEGMSLDQKLSVLIDVLEQQIQSTNEPTQDEFSSVYLGGNVGVTTPSYPKVDFSVETGISSNKVSWDYTSIINSLPTDQTFRRTQILITGGNRILIDSNKKQTSIQAIPSSFPIVISARMFTESATRGPIEYYNSITLSAENTVGSLQLEPKSIKGMSIDSQSEFNNMVLDELTRIKSQL